MGNGVGTIQLMKMVAGVINLGRPVANLYFSMWSHDVISGSLSLAADLKIGRYLKIPPRVMFLTQDEAGQEYMPRWGSSSLSLLSN